MATKTIEDIRNTAEYKALGDVPGKLEKAVASFRKQVKAIQSNARLSEAAKKQDIDNLRATFLKDELGTIRKVAEGLRDDLKKQFQVTDTPTTDTNALLLAEMKEQRAWNRIRPVLDASGGDLVAMVEELAAGRDPHVVAALRAELPSYLRARDPGAHGTDLGLMPSLTKIIDTSNVTFEEQQAEAQKKELERAFTVANTNILFVEEELTTSNLERGVTLACLDGTVKDVSSDSQVKVHFVPYSQEAAD